MEEKDRECLKGLWEIFLDEELIRILFSNPANGDGWIKARVRPLSLKGRLVFQLEEFTVRQAFHQNLAKEEGVSCLTDLLQNSFRQCEIQSEKGWAQVLVSKKGKITIKKKLPKKTPEKPLEKMLEKPPEKPGFQNIAAETGSNTGSDAGTVAAGGTVTDINARADAGTKLAFQWKDNLEKQKRLQHNRRKTYVLEEGIPIPFLEDLGVMTKEGKIVRSRYDKFRQINRFLEFIQDILPQLSAERKNTIIDFGCGKSYLTFAMYYYLHQVKKYPVQIIGLDLKQDVIDHCSKLSEKYGFTDLAFCHGDIASYKGVSRADMVVTLHACDTATDYALAKAVGWKAKVILSVPCCQHEWNQQAENRLMAPVLKYGLLKERMSALCTDGIRAEILEHMGYRTQILEFIDMEHTPKNILIRAIKQGPPKQNLAEIQAVMDFWGVQPTLAKLLL